MSENVKEITDANFAETTATGITLVDFWAPWCGPCVTMGPILDEVAGDVNFATVGKINVDENTVEAAKYGVQSIPTLLIFKDGEMKKQLVGVQSADDLIAELEKLK